MWALYVLALFRSQNHRRWRRRLFGSFRVCAYVLAMTALGSVVFARRALGRVHEQAFALGEQLLPLADLLRGTTALRINGEPLFFSMSAVHDRSVHDVLARVRANCEQHPGPFAKYMSALAESVPNALPGATSVRRALRDVALHHEETDQRGLVVCLAASGAEHDAQNVGDALAESADLATLGSLRYVLAVRGEGARGSADVTKVVALWTEGQFRLDHLQPPLKGDAPGSDSRTVPRLPGSVRLFSAEAVGSAYGLRIYQTDAPAQQVFAFYDHALADWASLTRPGLEASARGYVKNSQPVLISVTRDESKTLVTVSELGTYGEGLSGGAQRHSSWRDLM